MRKQGKPTEPTNNLPAKPSTAPKGIDIADLLAYRKKGLSHAEIAKIAGCCEQNVQQRLAEEELETLDNFRDNKDHVMESIQRKALKNIGDAELKRLNPFNVSPPPPFSRTRFRSYAAKQLISLTFVFSPWTSTKRLSNSGKSKARMP